MNRRHFLFVPAIALALSAGPVRAKLGNPVKSVDVGLKKKKSVGVGIFKGTNSNGEATFDLGEGEYDIELSSKAGESRTPSDTVSADVSVTVAANGGPVVELKFVWDRVTGRVTADPGNASKIRSLPSKESGVPFSGIPVPAKGARITVHITETR